MRRSLIFIRHGLSEANRNQIVQGQSDWPLADEGRQQSKQLADHFVSQPLKPDTLISSPLLRARETAEILASQLDCPVEFDEIWMERFHGQAQGKDYETVSSWYKEKPLPSPYEPIFTDGEGELELYLRAGQALLSLMRRPSGIYFVVSHGGIMNTVLHVLLGISPTAGRTLPPRFRFENTGYTELEFDDELSRWYLRCHNATPHLSTFKF